MNPERTLRRARRLFSAKRVYAEPVERDGVTLVPAARIFGGAGGGAGEERDGRTGGGTGFGVIARPVGAWVVRDGNAEWKPARPARRFDLNNVPPGAPAIALLILIALWLLRRRDA
jgi:uncharacterized spore protein YtfJ